MTWSRMLVWLLEQTQSNVCLSGLLVAQEPTMTIHFDAGWNMLESNSRSMQRVCVAACAPFVGCHLGSSLSSWHFNAESLGLVGFMCATPKRKKTHLILRQIKIRLLGLALIVLTVLRPGFVQVLCLAARSCEVWQKTENGNKRLACWMKSSRSVQIAS